jgi:hypothetical protein
MSTSNSKNPQTQPHTPGQTEGHRKGLDDQNASQSKPRHNVSQDSAESAGDDPIPTFTEGERGPSPIESPDAGGLRTPAPVVSADPKAYDRDKAAHADATMPPGEGQDPKRNTM